jgi:hypothetical protein
LYNTYNKVILQLCTHDSQPKASTRPPVVIALGLGQGGLTGSTCFHLSPLAFPSPPGPPLHLYPLACIDLVIGPVLVAAAGESGSVSIKI